MNPHHHIPSAHHPLIEDYLYPAISLTDSRFPCNFLGLMKELPVIIVQLVHIQGPLKGQIQEFTEPAISMGRHPSCQVQFPAELTSISRKHAELVREGNRYKLIDRSANGTFVNGKKITEAFLKDGDVIMLAEGGPKASFLAKITDAVQVEKVTAAPAPEPTPAPKPVPLIPVERVVPPALPVVDSFIPVKEVPKPSPGPRQPVLKVQAPLIVQFGPTLRSYKELPVIIGKKADCEFVLNHPAIVDQHAQIFFNDNQYWVRDLTGRNSISINGVPIGFEAPLKPQDVISLVQNGPAFRFLGEGRLAEQEAEEQVPSAPREKLKPSPAGDEKKEKSFFKDFFKK